MTKNNLRRNNVRVIGQGTLIILGLFVLIAGMALWLGPPRPAENFTLDDEDIGLGFRVGDSYGPSKYDSLLSVLDFSRIGANSISEESPLEVAPITTNPIEPGLLYTSSDETIMLLVFPDNLDRDASISDIIVSAAFQNIRKLQLGQESAVGFLSRLNKEHTEIGTDKGVRLGSREWAVSKAYGEPLYSKEPQSRTPRPGQTSELYYLGNKSSWRFTFFDGFLGVIYISDGYKNGGVSKKIKSWISFLSGDLGRDI